MIEPSGISPLPAAAIVRLAWAGVKGWVGHLGCVIVAAILRDKEENVAHITFFRMKAQPGKRQAVIDQFARWEREQKTVAAGFLRSVVVTSNDDPDELMAAVRFASTESYAANSDRADQGAWYSELRSLLAADPEWFNGTLAREATA